jgi:signal transduction histidine kinase
MAIGDITGAGRKLEDCGLEVVELDAYPAFAKRDLHPRDHASQTEGIRRLAHAFVENPDTILQKLVDAAIDLCGAESAGISLKVVGNDGAVSYHWVATAGKYGRFLNAMLPPFPSACDVCIQRGKPQLFRVTKPFFDLMQIEAETVTDGLLLPWRVDDTEGTVWIMAHGRDEAFDVNDCRVMQALADFAAMGVRQQRQQKILMEKTRAAAAASMANQLAHNINNPLQSLTNIVYLAAEGQSAAETQTLAREMSIELERLSALVKQLLSLPVSEQREVR